MKYKKFEEATHLQPLSQLAGGKIEKVMAPFHSEGKGFVVMCLEVNKEDLKRIEKSGQIWAIFGPGFQAPPAFSLQAKHPFKPDPDKKPLSNITDVTGKPYEARKPFTENENPPSAGDDKQSDDSDNKSPAQ